MWIRTEPSLASVSTRTAVFDGENRTESKEVEEDLAEPASIGAHGDGQCRAVDIDGATGG